MKRYTINWTRCPGSRPKQGPMTRTEEIGLDTPESGSWGVIAENKCQAEDFFRRTARDRGDGTLDWFKITSVDPTPSQTYS
jgi:hypothetical protein